MSRPLGELRPATDSSVADWLFGSLHPFERFDVGIVIPPGYEAYTCLLHAERSYDDQVRGGPRLDDVRVVAGLLETATSTPDECSFCVWNGWGWLGEKFSGSAPIVGDETRQYHLFSGPVEAVVDSSPRTLGYYQAPSLWWPDDRAWIVASEIDHWWTYVGGATSLVDRVVEVWRFGAKRVTPDDPLDWNALE
jgi:hypothetical protein